jgi:hypothetical protein
VAVTVNIYTENTVRYLSTYGGNHQSASSAWVLKESSFLLVPCTTTSSQFNSAFTGTLTSLLSSGVLEVLESTGYVKGAIALPYRNYVFVGPGSLNFQYQENFSPNGTGLLFTARNGSDQSTSVIVGSGTYNFSSFVIALTLPVSTPANASELYDSSYPLAMYDMGGSVTKSTGVLPVDWSGDPTVRWTLA